jgi:cholesterol transport system auxiliary component
MLQELLVRGFEKSGKIGAVDRWDSGVRADFVLTTDLQRFQVKVHGGTPDVHVEMTARLVRVSDRAIIASKHFEATIPAGANFDSIIGGFDEALQQLLPQIVVWTFEQGRWNS